MMGAVSVFTNADHVYLYKNGNFVTELTKGGWDGLPHGPMILDDTVGCLLETQEGFEPKKAELLRTCLLAIQKRGLANMTPADIAKMGYAMVKYGMKYEDAVALYGKYIGNWGGEATVWRLDGEKDGDIVASYTCSPSAKLHLEVKASHRILEEKDTYDMAAVRIRILDENGNVAPYAQIPVQLALEGPAELVGPAVVTAEGGMTGTYIKTAGKTGTVKLTVTTTQTEPAEVVFEIK
jgi:beta-galactosidase